MSAFKAAVISPLVICVAAPFYGAWLYHQMTSVVPTTPGTLALVARIASTWAVLFLPLAYILVFTYGQVFLRVARARNWHGAGHYLAAGAAPAVLALALPFSWQEALVPAALFGGLTGLAFWRLNRTRSRLP